MAGGNKKYKEKENVKMKKMDIAAFFVMFFLLAISFVSTTLNLNNNFNYQNSPIPE